MNDEGFRTFGRLETFTPSVVYGNVCVEALSLLSGKSKKE